MQAICENCGKTITPEDFRAGRYFLFYVTPTIPTNSLYLCDDCRGLAWEKREALFQAWWERHHGATTRPTRPARKKRLKRQRQPQAESPAEPLPWWENPEEKHRRLSELAQKAFALSR